MNDDKVIISHLRINKDNFDVIELTNQIRWLRRKDGTRVLQQAWQNIETGELLWVDVKETEEE